MKRYVSLLLVLITLFSLTACSNESTAATTQPETLPPLTKATEPPYTGFKVPNPMTHPDYSFGDRVPTVDELRKTAVKAMEDVLSVQWCVEKARSYSRTLNGKEKVWLFTPGTIYSGVPYTNAGTGLFQWLKYYDSSSGRLMFDGPDDMINMMLGNSCYTCVMWSLFTVCNSVKGHVATQYMVPANGYYPVGDFKIPAQIISYQHYLTSQIIKDNGADKILEAYAKVQPADCLVSEDDDHAMMVREAAYVVRDENGNIDPAKSYITILDQRTWHNSKSGEVKEGENTLHFSGRTAHKYYFDKLLEDCYIPVTIAEFMGKKAYEKPVVTFEGKTETCTTIDDLTKGKIISNYDMAAIELILEDEAGNQQRISVHTFCSSEIFNGITRKYSLSSFKTALGDNFDKKLEAGRTYQLRVEVTTPNGQIFVPVEIAITK